MLAHLAHPTRYSKLHFEFELAQDQKMKTAALLTALVLLVPEAAMADNDETHFCFIDNEQVPCPDQVKAPTPVADVGEPVESTPTK